MNNFMFFFIFMRGSVDRYYSFAEHREHYIKQGGHNHAVFDAIKRLEEIKTISCVCQIIADLLAFVEQLYYLFAMEGGRVAYPLSQN